MLGIEYTVLMTIILFIIVLVALIVVHEFGHFVVAKLSGMRVDEFGIGYPPRAWGKKIGETEYTLNWLPFGGFVKIYGEDEGAGGSTQEAGSSGEAARAFGARPRILQAAVLIAGITMNLLFAYLLITVTLMLATPRALSPEEVAQASDVRIVVADMLTGGPAASAGLVPGDMIVRAEYGGAAFTGSSPLEFTTFLAQDTHGEPIQLTIERDGEVRSLSVTPRTGVVPAEPARPALGIAIATAGVLRESLPQALVDGAQVTWSLTEQTAVGLYHFFASVFTLTANLAQVSGPVGIAGAVGSAGSHGLAALLSITAIISINLALINVLPLPALDGGRLLFVLIEGITRKPIPATVGRAVNGLGFALLVILMVVVTAHDIFKLFS